MSEITEILKNNINIGGNSALGKFLQNMHGVQNITLINMSGPQSSPSPLLTDSKYIIG